MKTFPAAFAAEMKKQTGACPLWILKFAAGGVTYYLSDTAFICAPWGITTKPWVKKWGTVEEGITSAIDEFKVSDFSVDVLRDPTANPNIIDLVKTYNLKASAFSLYLWFYGIADPPQEMFRGYVRKHPIPDDNTVQLQLQDETLRFERTYIGVLVDTATYPNADPDDVGKVIPIPFGTVKKLRALAVNAGIKTSLPANINAVVTSFAVSESGLTAGMVVTIDEEEILINTVAGETITNCTRGYNGTIAAVHQKAGVVWEKKTSFDYLVSARPLDSLPKVYGRIGQVDLDITSICTRYTGKPGNAHASYPGKTVVTVPGYVTASQAIDLLLNDGIGIDDAISIVDDIGVADTIAVSDLIGVSDTIGVNDGIDVYDGIWVNDVIGVSTGSHGHGTVKNVTDPQNEAWPASTVTTTTGYTTGSGVANFPSNPAAGRVSTTLTINLQCVGIANLQIWINGTCYYNATPPSQTFSFSKKFTSGTGLASNTIGFSYTGVNGVSPQGVVANSAQRVIEYTDPVDSSAATGVAKTGSASKAGAATKTGSATKTGTVAKTGSATKTGGVAKTGTASRLGSVTKTGTVTLSGNSVANTLIGEAILVDVVDSLTKPIDVISWLGSTYCGIASARLVGTMPASYNFNGVITERKRALEWFNRLAFECRCRFEMRLGSARLIYRPDTITPVKTIAACRVVGGKRDYSQDDTSFAEIINKIDLLFDRDYSTDSANYRGISKDQNNASITDHGIQERPELFRFGFITTQDMADHVRAFYLLYYAYLHWTHTLRSFLWEADLEYADGVTLGFAGNVVGEVVQAKAIPGNSGTNDLIGIIAVQ